MSLLSSEQTTYTEYLISFKSSSIFNNWIIVYLATPIFVVCNMNKPDNNSLQKSDPKLDKSDPNLAESHIKLSHSLQKIDQTQLPFAAPRPKGK